MAQQSIHDLGVCSPGWILRDGKSDTSSGIAVEERIACWLTSHAIYGALPPLSGWIKPAGSTMEMSPRQATMDFFFRDGNGMKIPDAAGENKGSRASTACKHQRTEKHVFKYTAKVTGSANQIAHAASSKHRGDQPVFIHLLGVHYTFICVMRSRYLCKDNKLHKKFAGGGTADSIQFESTNVDSIAFVDKAYGTTWAQDYNVSRAQEMQHLVSSLQRYAVSATDPVTPWTAADCEYQLSPVWAIDYSI